MVDVIIDNEPAYCLPDCTCCTACHKLITEVDECPFPEPAAEVTAAMQGWLYVCRAQAVPLKRKQEAHTI